MKKPKELKKVKNYKFGLEKVKLASLVLTSSWSFTHTSIGFEQVFLNS